MHSLVRFTLIALVGAFSIPIAAAPVSAASTIVIKVDDQPITSYDISQRSRLLQLTGGGGEKAAKEELIDETLQFIEAAKRGVNVPESSVDGAIGEIASRTKLTPAKLKQALAAEGVDIETLRRRIKAQMTWQQLVQLRIRMEGASVKGSDVMAALFEGEEGGEIKTTEYTLQQIVFVIPKGSSSGYVNQRRREAEAFRSRFAGCDASLQTAKQLKGVVVKNMGRRTTEELAGPDGEEIRRTSEGKTTRPLKTDSGYELIAVCSTRSLESNAAARVQAENKLMFEQNKELGKEYLAELREKAVIEYR
jgi:peptidyl-prolyl cis-trans isomerase SurA